MQVSVDGTVVDLYLAHFAGVYSGTDNVADINYSVPSRNRRYLSYFDSDESVDASGYFKPQLLGGSLEYDEDLSQAHCGCDAALYLIRMPAVGSDGQPDPTDGYFYCGSQFGKALCPEFDVMEANAYSWRTNAHACASPDAVGHYEQCDSEAKCGVD